MAAFPKFLERPYIDVIRVTNWIARILAAYAVVGGTVSLLGWALDLPRLTDWDGKGISILPNAAVAAIAAGVTVLLISRSHCRAAIPFALVVAAIGISSAYQIVAGVDIKPLNTLLMFGREWGNRGAVVPGLMGTPGTTSWSLIGTALLLVAIFHGKIRQPDGVKVRSLASIMVVVSAMISMLSLIGYLYGAKSLYTIPLFTVIAMQTASFVFAVSVAAIMVMPDVGLMRLIADSGPAGVMARRAFPAILVGPVIIGMLRLGGDRAGLYDIEFGTAIRTMVEILLFLGLLAWTAQDVRRETRRAEEQEIIQRHAQEDRDLLFTIAEKIRTVRTPSELLTEVADIVGRYLEVDRCLFNEIFLDRDIEVVHGDYSRSGTYVSGEHKLSDYSQISSDSMKLGHTVVNRDSKTDPRTADLFERIYGPNNEHAYVTVPMLRDGKWVASLWCSDDKARDWTDQEIELLENVAERTWAAIERLRADEQRRNREQMFSTLVDTAPFGIYFIDADFRLTSVNHGAQAVFSGIEPLIGRDFEEILRIVWPAPFADEALEKFRHTLATGEPYFSPTITEKRGNIPETQSYDWQLHRITLENGRYGVVCYFYDLTRQKKLEAAIRSSEERFKLAQDAGSVGIWDWDIPNDRTYWSDQMWTLYDEVPQSLNPDVDFWRSHIHEDDRELATATFRQSLISRSEHHNDTFRVVRKDGSVAWIESIATIERDDEGNAKRMYGVNIDISEIQIAREELEARVVDRTQELAEANSMLLRQMEERAFVEEQRIQLLKRLFTVQEDERSRIARDIHDHLGQRLTALRLKIASVKDICGDDPTLIERVERLQEISELLDKEVSFLAWELRPDTLDKTNFVHALEQYVREWSRHSNIFAEFDVIGMRGVKLDRDVENNLYRITQEALNNAAKYAGAEQINVLLEKRGEHLILIVEDNGVGFDVSAVQNNGRGRRSLGLIGMRERASLIGGNLEVESSRGKGTTVFINVPLNEKSKVSV